jgi:hypothetical protein
MKGTRKWILSNSNRAKRVAISNKAIGTIVAITLIKQGIIMNDIDYNSMIVQGTRQEAKQQAKLAPEELVGMQTASYALLNELLMLIGKKERGALVAISEVLSAFKQNQASELEVIATFFQQVKAGNVAGLENKKAILLEIAQGTRAEHSEQLWKYIRSWAGSKASLPSFLYIRSWAGSKASLPLFNSYIQNNDSKETIILHAKNWFIQQQSEALATMQQLQAAKLNAEMEVIAAKAESKVATTQAEKIAVLASKATRTKLSDEEVTYLFTFAEDEIVNSAMEAQMELASKAEIKEKLASKNIASEDL